MRNFMRGLIVNKYLFEGQFWGRATGRTNSTALSSVRQSTSSPAGLVNQPSIDNNTTHMDVIPFNVSVCGAQGALHHSSPSALKADKHTPGRQSAFSVNREIHKNQTI